MRRIVAATDFSERSRRAVRRAAMLARASGAHLMVLHVADDDREARVVEAEVAAARAALDAMKEWLPETPCEARVELGDPFDGIVRTARDCAADLIVMGTHRRQLLRDIFVGTSIERVTRARVAPVLMVNAEPAAPYRRALLGVDLSQHSAQALRFARESGILGNAELALAHAFDAVAKGKLNFAGVERAKVAEYVGEVESQARADLEAFVAAHPGQPAPVAMRVAEGHPATVLAAVSRAIDADLVIVATHGLSSIARLLLGSVTEALMRDLDRDVLAVPP
ncbi:MAG TPA: universal stress protein [Usitatibacter sp.]|nr:universal stress protein [Usitatibacter sp.]